MTNLIRSSEEEYDLKAYNQAMKEFEKNQKTYTLDEVEEELGLMKCDNEKDSHSRG